MSSPPDELHDLIVRVALRDQQAFEQLYRATSSYLLGVAFAVTHQRERAEEALQEAFMNVWHGAGGFRVQQASAMTWLIHIVRNKAIDHLRVGAAERRQSVELDESVLESAEDSAPDPLRLVEASLARHRIDTCMQELSAGQRQALALAFFRGLAHAEIAQTMKAPMGTVKAWIRRGSDRLRKCLQAAGLNRSADA